MKALIVFCIYITSVTALAVDTEPKETYFSDVDVVKVMEVNEITFHSEKSYGNPYMDVDLWVTLTGPNGEHYKVPAFWDGGQVFRVRLVATKPGRWNWLTGKSTGDSGLDGKSGSFDATSWTEAEKEVNPNRRGFIRVAENGHTLETWFVEPDAVPVGAFDMHTVSNRYRDPIMFGQLRDIFDASPTLPAANVEPYYPGWGNNQPAEGLDDNTMAQFIVPDKPDTKGWAFRLIVKHL